MEEKTKKRGWVKDAAIVFLAVLLVLTFFSSTILNRSLPEVATEYVMDGTITSKVRGTGTVIAKENYDVTIDQTRKVQSVIVRVGDEVAAGDVLFILQAGDSSELDMAKEELASLEEQYQRMLLTSTGTDYSQEDRSISKAQSTLSELRIKASELQISDAERIEFNLAYASLQKELEECKRLISEKKQAISEILSQFNDGSQELRQRIWDLKSVVEEKKAVVAEKELIVREKEAVVAEKNKGVEAQEKLVREAEAVVREKNELVRAAEELVRAAEGPVRAAEAVVREKELLVEEKQAVVDEKQLTVDDLQEVYEELQSITAEKRRLQAKEEAERDARQAEYDALVREIGTPGDVSYDRLESAGEMLSNAEAALERAKQELQTQQVLYGDKLEQLKAEALQMMEEKFRSDYELGPEDELSGQQAILLSTFQSNSLPVYLAAAAQQHAGDELGGAYQAISSAEDAVENAQRAYNSAMSSYDSAYADYLEQSQSSSNYQKRKKELDAKQQEIDAAKALVDAAALVVKAAEADEEAALKEVNAAKKLVDAAEKDVKAAQRVVDEAKKGVTEANRGVEDAQRGVEDAQREVAEAQRGVEAAQRGVEDAQRIVAEAQRDVDAVQAVVNEAQAAVDLAQKDVMEAQSTLSAWESRDVDALKPEQMKLAEQQKELEKQQTALQEQAEKAQADADKLKADMENREEAYKSAKEAAERQQETLEDLLFNLEQQKKSDNTSQQLAAMDRQKLLDSINKKQEEINSLSSEDSGTEVRARVAGTIQTISVSAGHAAQAGAVLATIEVPDLGYSLSFSVTNDQARRLHVGDTSTISNYYWGSEINATLISIQTDPQNPQGSKLLTFDVTGDVTAGSSLTLAVGEKNASYDMVVPNSAIRNDVNGSFVLKVTAKNSPLGNRYFATRVDVTVVASDEKFSAISGGIESYDSVITTASRNAPISAGDQVRLADTNT